MPTLKESINSLVDDGRPDAQKPRANRQPIGAKVGSSAGNVSGSGNGGILPPLEMKIIETTTRSIDVPDGATVVDVEDAAKFTLTDANGNVYTVSSIIWPD